MLFRSSPSSDGDPTTTHNLHAVVRTLLWWLAITVGYGQHLDAGDRAPRSEDTQRPVDGARAQRAGVDRLGGRLRGRRAAGIPVRHSAKPAGQPAGSAEHGRHDGGRRRRADAGCQHQPRTDFGLADEILVGVGLTQFQSLQGQLAGMATYFAVAGSAAVTLAIILNSSVAGFFAGYLLTRLFLMSAFDSRQPRPGARVSGGQAARRGRTSRRGPRPLPGQHREGHAGDAKGHPRRSGPRAPSSTPSTSRRRRASRRPFSSGRSIWPRNGRAPADASSPSWPPRSASAMRTCGASPTRTRPRSRGRAAVPSITSGGRSRPIRPPSRCCG